MCVCVCDMTIPEWNMVNNNFFARSKNVMNECFLSSYFVLFHIQIASRQKQKQFHPREFFNSKKFLY